MLTGGDRDAFEGYVRARSTSLLRTAYLLTGDRGEAEDLLQTALSRLATSWHRVERAESLDGYVRRILANEATSRWRRRRVPAHSVADLPEPLPVATGPDAETRIVVWQALGRLTARQRAVVVLRYYEDLSERETAAVLGTSLGNVKSTASRAIALLRADTGIDDLGADYPRLEAGTP